MKSKFYYCKRCGNVVVKLSDSGVVPVCCSEEMVELQPNEIDGVKEKHIPVVKLSSDGKLTVTVGETLHPMTPDHMIEFIVVETRRGGEIYYLKVGSEPKAEFCICPKDKPTAVYAYCNLHGLWVSKCF